MYSSSTILVPLLVRYCSLILYIVQPLLAMDMGLVLSCWHDNENPTVDRQCLGAVWNNNPQPTLACLPGGRTRPQRRRCKIHPTAFENTRPTLSVGRHGSSWSGGWKRGAPERWGQAWWRSQLTQSRINVLWFQKGVSPPTFFKRPRSTLLLEVQNGIIMISTEPCFWFKIRGEKSKALSKFYYMYHFRRFLPRFGWKVADISVFEVAIRQSRHRVHNQI